MQRLSSIQSASRAAMASRRSFSSIQTAYTASATVKGNRREGTGETGPVKVKFGMPKEMGGQGDPAATNPEQLFALGYGACFNGALNLVYSQAYPKGKKLPADTKLTVEAGIGKPNQGEGFAVAVHIKLHHDSIKEVVPDRAKADELLQAAHKACPYSKATKGNIEHIVELV